MSKVIQLDVNKARKAGNYVAQLEKSGAYVGAFTHVKFITPPWGGRAMEFNFKSTDGLTADYITVPLSNEKGEIVASGDNLIHGMLLCAGLINYSCVPSIGKAWDGQSMVDGQIEICPELINVPIGVVLQKKLYTKKNGYPGVSWKMINCFNADNRKTPSEIDDDRDAFEVDDILKTLSDYDARSTQQVNAPETKDKPIFDDDMPF